jgi:prepilin-type processing-associated H-X9-DG protein/prepilin-type N-terminal cleavage/methylation domain-containing protein
VAERRVGRAIFEKKTAALHDGSHRTRDVRMSQMNGSKMSVGLAKLRAFTLVELLVVIGIIAVLVGILLPALSRARQQANLITCQTHLRQIGQAIFIYVADNQGFLPYGYWNGTYLTYTYDNTKANDWGILLSNLLSSRLGNDFADQTKSGGLQQFNRGIFLDVDTPANGDAQLQYSAHPRLMPNLGTPISSADTTLKNYDGAWNPYKLAHVQRASEIALIFCGALTKPNTIPYPADPNYWGAEASGFALDNWAFSGAAGTGPTSPATSPPADFLLYNLAVDNGISIDGGYNTDDMTGNPNPTPSAKDNWGNIRWRHMNNNVANFLFCDGHVESRAYNSRYKTELLGKNINVNP